MTCKNSFHPRPTARICRALLGLVAISFILMLMTDAYAAKLDITPQILGRVTWNSHFFLEDINDVEFRSEPQLKIDYTQERWGLGATGGFSSFRYLDNTDYNRTNYTAGLQTTHAVTDRLTAGIGGKWTQDYSVDSYWDAVNNAKYILFLKRDTYAAFFNSTYQLTERDTIDLNGGYTSMTYDEKKPGYAAYDAQSANMTWRHSLYDGTLALVSQLSWQRVDFDLPETKNFFGAIVNKTDIVQNVYNGLIGLHWMPSEQIQLQALAGTSHTRSQVHSKDTVWLIKSDSTKKYNTTGFTGMVESSWKDLNNTVKFSIKQDRLPSTFGEMRTVTTTTLDTLHKFSSKLNVGGLVSYVKTKTDNVSDNKISRQYWRGNVHGVYSVTEDLSLRLNYTYIHYYNKINGRKIDSNAIFFQLFYQFPMQF